MGKNQVGYIVTSRLHLMYRGCVSFSQGIYRNATQVKTYFPKKKRDDKNGSIHVINVYLSKTTIHVSTMDVDMGCVQLIFMLLFSCYSVLVRRVLS